MAFSFSSDFGNNASGGFIYITQSDGTTIVANILNNNMAWHTILRYANTSTPLYSSSQISKSTLGYRFFGKTAADGAEEGNLAGADEITRFVVLRSANGARYAASATIAAGVITADRVSNDMKISVDTEGGAGTDDLDTITINDVVDNDTITILGISAARRSILKHGAGNIFLSNNTDFTTTSGNSQITLRYMTFGGVTGWYEVSRVASLPTVTAQRAVNVAIPVQGVDSNAMPNNGTVTFEAGVHKGYQVITGSPNLAGAIVYEAAGTPIDGDEFVLDYRATPTLNGNTVTVFGITLTTTQTQQKLIVITKYRTADTTWYSSIYVNVNNIDFATLAQLASKEDSLDNPAGDGFFLSSLTDGTRFWATNGSNIVLHNDTSNNATGAGVSQQILKTYTLPGGTANLDGDIIKIAAVYQTAANNNGKTVSVYFGAMKVAEIFGEAAMNEASVIVAAEINRIDVNNQSATAEVTIYDSSNVYVDSSGKYSLPSENLSANMDITCRATDALDSPDDVICRQFSVSILKKRN